MVSVRAAWGIRGGLLSAAVLLGFLGFAYSTHGAVGVESAVVSGPSGQGAAATSGRRLAVLLSAHEAYSRPGGTSRALTDVQAVRPLTDVQAVRPLTGEQTVLPVLGTAQFHGGVWLQVMLPGRPDGRSGWITASGTRTSATDYSVVVDTTRRTLTVDYDGYAVRTAAVVVGKPSTPTPAGKFFVEEVLQLPADAVGAPYAFALSARSNVLQEFDGGPGQIAMHGLDNVGGVLGTAASHGCVRLDTSTLTWMVTRIGPGTPVTVVG
ncbi:MAG TPA: L,D-transpeptidase [Acidimicrobiales bacterium]|nr:L,D-transpeptidase [Acidimicrobiales bacterium]